MMSSILDFTKELDIPTLDSLVNTLYTESGTEQQQAQEIVSKFQKHPDAWKCCDRILQYSKLPTTKFIALSILSDLINTRWKMLPQNQRTGIKEFGVGMIISFCQDNETFKTQRGLIQKADLILVQLLKMEWPANWPDFIPELLASARTSENLCENSMVILRLLSEELFDFTKQTLTQAKSLQLQQSMTTDFNQIFAFCLEILGNSNSISLLKATLHSILNYLQWISYEYIFNTKLLELLLNKFLLQQETKSLTLQCLTEIAQLTIPENQPQLELKSVNYFSKVVELISGNLISVTLDLKEFYANATSEDQIFLQNFTIFLTTYLMNHKISLESKCALQQVLLDAHQYLIHLSKIDELELFKTTLDYWFDLVSGLYQEIQRFPQVQLSMNASSGAINPAFLRNFPFRKHIYDELSKQLITVIIEKMARPEEVIVTLDENGQAAREVVGDSELIQLYTTLHQILVYLTHLNVNQMEEIMLNRLTELSSGSENNTESLNRLCWAIGSISGAMTDVMEGKFLETIIVKLLQLSEMGSTPTEKALLSSNLMYVVGQYPRFLKSHYEFCKTIVLKLFEYMKDTNEGVQDMACDTYIKVARKCGRLFITPQLDESELFIDLILNNIQEISSSLYPHNVYSFYKGCAFIVREQRRPALQVLLLERLLTIPNESWSPVIKNVLQNPQMIQNMDTMSLISDIIQINLAVCSGMEHYFGPQLEKIYKDLLELYKLLSNAIQNEQNNNTFNTSVISKVRLWKKIKKSSLKIFDIYICNAKDFELTLNVLVDPLLNCTIDDYKNLKPSLRDPEVLHLLSRIVNTMGIRISKRVSIIFENIFEITLDMINKEFVEYPEHRLEFYKLLQLINKNNFSVLLELPEEKFNLFVNAICWGFKHNSRDIELLGLQIAFDLLQNVENLGKTPIFAKEFYENYFSLIISETFFVLVDSDHEAGFSKQASLLKELINLVENNRILVPIYKPTVNVQMSNHEYLITFLSDQFMKHFPNLSSEQILGFLQALTKNFNDFDKFKGILRDFLVQVKEFGGDPTDYLFAENELLMLEEKKQAERKNASKIGGMIKPSDLEDD